MSGPIVIAAGGTGGHLFPGQALGQALQRRGREIAVMTDTRVADVQKRFPDVPVYPIPSATPYGGGPLAQVRAILPILRGTLAAYSLLGKIGARAVIGFGGYPTLPPLLAAWLRGLPTAVHEQNAVLGRVNRLMGPRVTAIASTFATPKYLKPADAAKLVLTGNPVRDNVRSVAATPYAASEGDAPFNLLVFGGSQGARVMSDIVPVALAAMDPALRARLKVTQQARPEDVERVRATYEGAGIAADISPFFENMHELIAASHLVIARSGASTVTELSVIGRPAILVPLPHAIDQDQLANAEVLEKAGGGWCMVQDTFTPERLSGELAKLMGTPDMLAKAAAAATSAARPDAAERLADLVEGLLTKSDR